MLSATSLPTLYVSAGTGTMPSAGGRLGGSDANGLATGLGASTLTVAVETGGVGRAFLKKRKYPASASMEKPITENNRIGSPERLRAGFGSGSGLIAGSALGTGSAFGAGSDFGGGSGFTVGLSAGTGAG